MIGQWLGRVVGNWLGHGAEVVAPPAVVREVGRVVRSRTGLYRKPKRYVEREIDTPDGPLRVLVPDDWSADDLLTLTTALVLSDALN